MVQKIHPRSTSIYKESMGYNTQGTDKTKGFTNFFISKVTKRDGDSSLMQLKEEFRTYDALRREHDAQ